MYPTAGAVILIAISVGLLAILAGFVLMFSAGSKRWPYHLKDKLMLSLWATFSLSMGVVIASLLLIAGEILSSAWSAL